MNENGEKKSTTAAREEETLRFWKENHVFEKTLEKDAPKGEFVFYDGPPFATGLPHMGHLLASSFKDLVGRYKTMRGYHVPRRWGWDCHGLPIESLVEKKLGLKTKKDILDIGIQKFNQTARESVLEFVRDWEWYVNRIGRWVDFENSYKTMDNTYIESVWWAIQQLHEKGRLYEGRRVLMYCPHCETPLAKAEIQMDNTYQDVTEEAVTVRFTIVNPEQHNLPANTSILAWTTTPWTLPGNVALAVGPDIQYVLVSHEGEYVVVAKERAEALGLANIEREFKGSELIGVRYEPLYEIPAVAAHEGKKHEVLGADFVTTTDGTGIVHTAVMYGEDDFQLGQKEGLPMVQLLDASGKYNEQAPEFIRGKYIKSAEGEIKADLESRGLLFARANNTHSYPHCYRCGTPLIYNAISSWFVDIQAVKQRMLKENEKVTWVPEHLKHGRFQNILENAPDWTISRNRFWASPLPIWKCEKCASVRVIGSVKELRESAQESVPDIEALDLHRPYIDEFTFVCECGGTMRRIPEVVDCWLESGSMPFAADHYPFENKELVERRSPGDFITEYIAQTRTWFYYTHVMGVLLFNRLAFKTVAATGTILAEDGSKMSKSKGNFTDPKMNLDRFGADALRYYLLGSPVMHAEDYNFRDEELREAHNRVVNMLWNCYQFYALYAAEREGEAVVSTHVLDRWIRARLRHVGQEITEALDAYDTPLAARALRDFIDDYSTWYVRRSRDRVKSTDVTDKQNALHTQAYVLSVLARLAAPLLPFIAEDMYRGVGGEQASVHLESWPEFTAESEEDMALMAAMEQVRSIVSLALEKRSAAGIKVRQPLSKLTIKQSFGTDDAVLRQVIAEEVNVKEVIFDPGLAGEVGLDTVITPELKEEGDVRDFLRLVQAARKDAGLNPGDEAVLTIQAEAALRELLERNSEQIRTATRVQSMTFGAVEGNEEKVGDYRVTLSVVRA